MAFEYLYFRIWINKYVTAINKIKTTATRQITKARLVPWRQFLEDLFPEGAPECKLLIVGTDGSVVLWSSKIHWIKNQKSQIIKFCDIAVVTLNHFCTSAGV